MAARRRGDRGEPRRRGARPHARDGGGGRQADAQSGPDPSPRKCRVVTRVSRHARLARTHVDAAAAEPSHRRPARHRGVHHRRSDVRLRRRGDRHQSGLGQPAGARRPSGACSTTSSQRYRDPHAELRPGPCDAHRSAPSRRGAPVDLVFQSIAGTEAANAASASACDLLHEARDAALLPERGTVGQQRDVLRDGAGERAVGERAPRRRSADAVRREPMPWRAHFEPAAGQHRRGLHRPGISLRRQADHPRRAGRPFLRQAAGPADGLRRLLHQPRRGRPGRHGLRC